MNAIIGFFRKLFLPKTYDIWYAKQKTAPYNGTTLHCTDYHRRRVSARCWQDAVDSVQDCLSDVTVLGVTECGSAMDGTFKATDNGAWSWQRKEPSLKEAMGKRYAFVC